MAGSLAKRDLSDFVPLLVDSVGNWLYELEEDADLLKNLEREPLETDPLGKESILLMGIAIAALRGRASWVGRVTGRRRAIVGNRAPMPSSMRVRSGDARSQ